MTFQPRPNFQDDNHETLVKNVYSSAHADETGQPILDAESWRNTGDFLQRRHTEVLPSLTVDGTTIMRPVTDVETVFERWMYLPPVKTGMGWRRATAAGFLAINSILNWQNFTNLAHDAKEEIAIAADNVADFLSDGEVCDTPSSNLINTETITTVKTDSYYLSLNKVGEFNPDDNVLVRMVARIEEGLESGNNVNVTSLSTASDEWLALQDDLRGIGSPTAENHDLSNKRDEAFSALLLEALESRGIDVSLVSFNGGSSESVLSEELINELTALLDEHSYELEDAISIANNSGELPDELALFIDTYFINRRGVEVEVMSTSSEILTATGTTETTAEAFCPETDPVDENRDYDWKLLPFIWPALPKFARSSITRMIPEQYISVLENPLDVLLHPDVSDQEKTALGENTWAYLRKYMHLLREDGRIKKVHELAYTDQEGQDQTLRALFVDHEPTEYAVQTIKEVFETASSVCGGRVGEYLDIVAIYPRESAGRQYGAKRQGTDIALGLDTQYDDGTLGVAFPALGIVEVHMDQNPTEKDMEASRNSIKWTLVHEILGHYTHFDYSLEQRQLTTVGQAPDGRTLFTTQHLLSETGRPIYEDFVDFASAMSEPNANLRQISWQAWMPGEEDPIAIRGVDDPRLLQADRLILNDANLSQYADSSHYEAWAEAAASHATGNPLPFEFSSIGPITRLRRQDPRDNVGGYEVDPRWVQLLQNTWGQLNDDQTSSLEQSWTHTTDDAINFEFMRELAEMVRKFEIWGQDDPRWLRLMTDQLY